jgi:hypothetical protein
MSVIHDSPAKPALKSLQPAPVSPRPSPCDEPGFYPVALAVSRSANPVANPACPTRFFTATLTARSLSPPQITEIKGNFRPSQNLPCPLWVKIANFSNFPFSFQRLRISPSLIFTP